MLCGRSSGRAGELDRVGNAVAEAQSQHHRRWVGQNQSQCCTRTVRLADRRAQRFAHRCAHLAAQAVWWAKRFGTAPPRDLPSQQR
jgi:hypothetical protein